MSKKTPRSAMENIVSTLKLYLSENFDLSRIQATKIQINKIIIVYIKDESEKGKKNTFTLEISV